MRLAARTRRTGAGPTQSLRTAEKGHVGSDQLTCGGVSGLSGQSGVRWAPARGGRRWPVRPLSGLCPALWMTGGDAVRVQRRERDEVPHVVEFRTQIW